MKKIEKTIEVKKTEIIYVAIDGTEFKSMPDCERYEKSVECSISVRLNDITINRGDIDSVFLEGCLDFDCQIVRPRNSSDINAINQLICLLRNQEPDKINEKNLVHDENIGECVVICYSDDHESVWIHTESEIRNHWNKMFSTKD